MGTKQTLQKVYQVAFQAEYYFAIQNYDLSEKQTSHRKCGIVQCDRNPDHLETVVVKLQKKVGTDDKLITKPYQSNADTCRQECQ